MQYFQSRFRFYEIICKTIKQTNKQKLEKETRKENVTRWDELTWKQENKKHLEFVMRTKPEFSGSG